MEGRLSTPLESVCGLLYNLSSGVDPGHLSRLCPTVTSSCYSLLTSDPLSDLAVQRSLGVISNILPHNPAAVTFMSSEEKVMTLINFLSVSSLQLTLLPFECQKIAKILTFKKKMPKIFIFFKKIAIGNFFCK